MNKKTLNFLTILLVLIFGAVAAQADFSQFNDAGGKGKDVVVEGVKAWVWIIGFLPFGFGIYSGFKMNEYLNQKDESGGGNTEPKASRYAKVFGAVAVSIILVYIILGLIGLVFAGKTFEETWDTFVIQLWQQIY